MRKIPPALCLFFYSFLVLHANNPKDSLHQLIRFDKEDTNKVTHLNTLCREYQKIGSYDTAFRYGDIALQLAIELEFPKGIATAYNNIGIIYTYQGNYSRALENYFAALKIRKEINDKQGIAASYNNIGNVYYNQGNYDKAMENYLASLQIQKKFGDKQGIAASYNNIGGIYYHQGKYDKALENHFSALKIRKETGDEQSIFVSYNNIGTIYCEQGKYDKALENHFAALKIRQETGDKLGIAVSYNNIGNIYCKQGSYDNALENYFAALKIRQEASDKQGLARIYIGIANVYTKKVKYTEAMEWLEKGIRLAKEIGANPLLLEAYRKLSEANEKMNDYRNAYKYFQLYSQLKDSLYHKASSVQMAEMQTKYETEKKENEIQFQSLKISEQQIQIRQNKTLQAFLFTGIAFIIIIALLLFNRNKMKQREILKTNLLEQQKLHTKAIIDMQEQERTRIACDLHDGIGQTLAGVIANYEQLTAEINLLSKEKQKAFHRTANSLDEAYKELRAISHQMMPRAIKAVGLTAAISDLLDKTLANTRIAYHFEKQNIENVPESIAVSMYRIFQELLGNILKHAQAGNVTVSLFKNQEQLILMVEDDGIGISQNKLDPPKTGIGLMNITARAEAMNGTFITEPGKEKGMIATVIIPMQTAAA
ncbi:MAG: tetratricopeptide repeat protein [Bacteroidetes bacterium]|nr:tetratricopeptide repeat protein [Bacteroidota bacterium]